MLELFEFYEKKAYAEIEKKIKKGDTGIGNINEKFKEISLKKQDNEVLHQLSQNLKLQLDEMISNLNLHKEELNKIDKQIKPSEGLCINNKEKILEKNLNNNLFIWLLVMTGSITILLICLIFLKYFNQ